MEERGTDELRKGESESWDGGGRETDTDTDTDRKTDRKMEERETSPPSAVQNTF